MRAEVFAGFDDAATEELFPRAIDCDAGRQRVAFIHQPFGQAQAICRRAFGQWWQGGGRSGIDLLALVGEVAAFAHPVGGTVEAGLFLHHQRRDDAEVFERIAQCFQLVAFGLQARRHLAEAFRHRGFLLFGSFVGWRVQDFL